MSIEKQLKQDAVDIFLAGVAAVDPGQAVRSHLKLEGDMLQAGTHRISLSPDTRVFVVGAGKAGAPMAAAVSLRYSSCTPRDGLSVTPSILDAAS